MPDLATDYEITAADARAIHALPLLPQEVRRIVLAKYLAEHGPDALLDLFAGFVGLANSVAVNARCIAETYLILGGDIHPHEAEKINHPDPYGALGGVILADRNTATHRCDGCAFRVGSTANQSAVTVSDAADCVSGLAEVGFFCHDGVAEGDEATRPCAGFLQATSRRGSRKTRQRRSGAADG